MNYFAPVFAVTMLLFGAIWTYIHPVNSVFVTPVVNKSQSQESNPTISTNATTEVELSPDKTHVIYDGQILEGADPATFVILDENGARYGKDKKYVWDLYYESRIDGAEGATFELIQDATGKDSGYEKDKDHVYARGNLIANADPETFVPLKWLPSYLCSDGFGKDAVSVFYVHLGCDGPGSDPFTSAVINQADPKTFDEILGNDGQPSVFERDAAHVFYGTKILSGGDPGTFSPVASSDEFWRDKNHVYDSNGAIIQGADPTTFAIVASASSSDWETPYFFPTKDNPNLYAKDSSHVWSAGGSDGLTIIKDADPASFSVIRLHDENYPIHFSKDAKRVYVGTKNVMNADPATFQPIIDSNGEFSDFAQDKNHIYYTETSSGPIQVLDQADFPTFTVGASKWGDLPPLHFALDKNYVYWRHVTYTNNDSVYYSSMMPIPGADPKTFTMFDSYVSGYAKDNSRIYYEGVPIVGADYGTFTVGTEMCGPNLDHEAQDKNHTYCVGKIVK